MTGRSTTATFLFFTARSFYAASLHFWGAITAQPITCFSKRSREADRDSGRDLRPWSFTQALLTSGGRGRITVQDGGRRSRWSSADAPTPTARRTCLLSIDCGEQLLAVAGKRPLDEIGVAAAQR